LNITEHERGGQVLNMNAKAETDGIKAQVPLAQMFGFMTALRSVSQGRAGFSIRFSHFEKKTGRSPRRGRFNSMKL
jgi:elongation factor G